ncbi:Nucleosomal histone H3-Lys79 methylase [Tieghemiomyces parasiticus]|uniref:Histone-lysine N-methyltransferase, H3 lysine-79 specific n=1 Tax=Tieghemiomyces parasiticus TaxID=78921 RepID=A0A9W8DXV6_9FUNG|nr:Nucleosomal histone H3-Lys79 methylase [Tieghemiomyces parasiticus]
MEYLQFLQGLKRPTPRPTAKASKSAPPAPQVRRPSNTLPAVRRPHPTQPGSSSPASEPDSPARRRPIAPPSRSSPVEPRHRPQAPARAGSTKRKRSRSPVTHRSQTRRSLSPITIPSEVTATPPVVIPASRGLETAVNNTPPISCRELVVNDARAYTTYFTWPDATDPPPLFNPVHLEYPGPGPGEAYVLAVPRSAAGDAYSPVKDLIATVQTIVQHLVPPDTAAAAFGTGSTGLLRRLERASNRRLGPDFVAAIAEFSAELARVKATPAFRAHLREVAARGLSLDLVTHLLHQVYSRTVAPHAETLTAYEAFSDQVYGEVNPVLVHDFIRQTGLGPGQVFVDLGCGIGNVVLQVAAEAGCESHGVEVMEQPSRLAATQAREFETRLHAYGLPHGRVAVQRGDFLNTPGLPATLQLADVVLVNNYAFSSTLNQRLLQLFLDLREGTQVISLRSFVPVDYRINARTAANPESILRVRQLPYHSDAVSWTGNGGHYFIHTVDRGPLQAFWARHGGA